MNYRKILLVFLIYIIPFQLLGQNFVVDFQAKHVGDQLKISISTLDNFNYEIIPFDSKTYTLIKLYPVQFKKETKDYFIEPLKKLPVKIQTLELMDQSLLLTFKGILQKQLQLNLKESVNKLEIITSLKLVANKTIEKSQKTAWDYYQSAAQLEKENRNLAAISAIRKALRLQPKYAEAYFLAGKIRFERGEWNMAKINFNQAKKINPNVGDSQPYLKKIENKLNPVQVAQKQVVQAEQKVPKAAKEVLKDSIAIISKEVTSDSASEIDSSFLSSEPVSIFNLKKSKPDSSVNMITEYTHQTSSQSYFQFAFLCFIVFVILVWGIILWKKRTYFKKEKKYSSFDFSKMIQQMQNQTPNLGNDMPEMNAPPSIQKVENLKIKNKSTNEYNRQSLQKTSSNSFSNQKARNFKTDFELTPPKENANKRPDDKILHLASLGYSIEEIARQLHIGKGEVQLILNFQGKETPMSAPKVRIEMD